LFALNDFDIGDGGADLGMRTGDALLEILNSLGRLAPFSGHLGADAVENQSSVPAFIDPQLHPAVGAAPRRRDGFRIVADEGKNLGRESFRFRRNSLLWLFSRNAGRFRLVRF